MWFPTWDIQLSSFLQLTFRFNLRPLQLLPKSSFEYLFILSFFILHMRRLELLSSAWKAESLPANLHMFPNYYYLSSFFLSFFILLFFILKIIPLFLYSHYSFIKQYTTNQTLFIPKLI